MTHDEMIAVIQHHVKGGKVEARKIFTPHWRDCDVFASFNFANYVYRVKPEPQVIYADFNDHGDPSFCSREKYTPPFGRKLRKFVEVEE